jgi:protein ATS1
LLRSRTWWVTWLNKGPYLRFVLPRLTLPPSRKMDSLQYLIASGSNACGQLATGSLEDSHTFTPCIFSGSTAGSLPPNTNNIVQIAAGSNHTLVLIEALEPKSGRTRKELWGCGDGRRGQLGPSLSQQSGSVLNPVELHLEDYGFGGSDIRLIATSWETSFIVLSRTGSNDVLISMGANDFGDLGIGKHKTHNNKANQKPFHIVDLHSLCNNMLRRDQINITSLTTGPHHVVLQLQASSAKDASMKQLVVGWGTSRHGQLGMKSRTTVFVSSPEIISVQKDLGSISSIALGNQHSVFLHQSGRVSGLGTDKKHQISGVSTLTHVRAIDCTWNGTYVIVEADEGVQLLSNGSNAKGQLGRPSGESEVSGFSAVQQLPLRNKKLQRIACGSEHVLALLTNKDTVGGEVWGWGWNEHGNLGIGTTEDVKEPRILWPPQSQVDSTSNVAKYGTPVNIWAGCGSSWIAVTNRDMTDRA